MDNETLQVINNIDDLPEDFFKNLAFGCDFWVSGCV